MSAAAAFAFATFAAGSVLILAALALGVKLRTASARGRGVRVFDLGADLDLPPTLHTRGYRFALYLTLKSLPRDAAPARITATTR